MFTLRDHLIKPRSGYAGRSDLVEFSLQKINPYTIFSTNDRTDNLGSLPTDNNTICWGKTFFFFISFFFLINFHYVTTAC